MTRQRRTLAGPPIPRQQVRGARGTGLPSRFFMTDDRRSPDPVAIAAHLPRGTAIIFRHYADARRADRATELALLCRRHGLILLVSADRKLAWRLHAGLHLPEGLARGRTFRRVPGQLLTIAAHGRAGLVRAQCLHADAALVSPVFATRSHPGARALGVVRFAALVARAGQPVIALGGVAAKQVRRLAGTGAAGIAGIGMFIDRDPPLRAAARPRYSAAKSTPSE